MSFWFYGRSSDGKRQLISVSGVFLVTMIAGLLLVVLLLPLISLIRAWVRAQ
jgi:hypothetical protein